MKRERHEEIFVNADDVTDEEATFPSMTKTHKTTSKALPWADADWDKLIVFKDKSLN